MVRISSRTVPGPSNAPIPTLGDISRNGHFTRFLNRTDHTLPTLWFLTLADAREKKEAWRRFYNEDRPHGAIGYKVPIALTEPGGAADPPP